MRAERREIIEAGEYLGFEVFAVCPVCGREHCTGMYRPEEPVYEVAEEMVLREARECCWES